jgi:hypothetical protein
VAKEIASLPRLHKGDDLLQWARVLVERLQDIFMGPPSVVTAAGPPIGPASGDLTGSYPGPVVGPSKITTSKLADAPLGVSTAKINDGAVTDVKIASVSWSKVTGAPPAGVVAYRHVQATAATVWNISHGLSFWPSVTAVDSTGREIWPGTVDYPSASSVTLTFSAAVGGEAYLS